jgi:hypothetical protein
LPSSYAERLALELRAEIGREVDGDAVGEHASSLERDAQPLAHEAVGPVGGDQVAAAHLPRSTAVDVGRRDGDARVVLVHIDDVVAGQDGSARLLGTGSQDRLEPRLRHEEAPARAHRLHTLVEAADDVGQLPARQVVHHHDGALGQELALRLGFHLVFDAGQAEQLERAEVEVRGPGQW